MRPVTSLISCKRTGVQGSTLVVDHEDASRLVTHVDIFAQIFSATSPFRHMISIENNKRYALFVFHQKTPDEVFRILRYVREGVVVEVVLRDRHVRHCLDVRVAHERW